jgi:uncharacterized peroxidase-related enzyme
MSDLQNAVKTFTVDSLNWQPWVETVDVAHLSPAQTEVLSEAPGGLEKIGPYYALLAHDPEVLRERTRLFNAVMYGRGGLPRRDRELASVAGSRVNGCTYCASVHGRIYNDLTKRTDVIERIFTEGVDTQLAQRERAIVDFSVRLTREPAALSSDDLQPLRDAGLNDAEILDLIHVVAMFAWANRLLQTLGHPTRDEVVLS